MTRVLVIGGFLGAGKTTLMLRTARRLAAQGKRVGLVTNDQAPDMVDTRLVRLAEFSVAEVAGGCICCRFNDFTDEIGRLLRELEPDVLLVEPVGSCVDLAATVLRPLSHYLPGLAICPLTTVVDPAAWLRMKQRHSLPAETAYIYRKQLAEADILLLNKSDIIPRRTIEIARAQIDALVPRAQILSISAQTGAGIGEWCDQALASQGSGRPIDVDYDTYAKGEAWLGWLNAILELQAGRAAHWEQVLPEFMLGVCGALGESGATPAHLKCLLSSGGFIAAANATLGSRSPTVRVLADGRAKRIAELVVNLRIALPPRYLRPALTTAMENLKGIAGKILSECSFAPARPVPQHRMA
jgi:Ni2+-binding GTPase involved in maturation of urease and hydrogenase